MALEFVKGTELPDVLVVNGDGGIVQGLGGDDVLRVAAGNVNGYVLNGGDDDDTLEGRGGQDVLIGGPGDDGLSGASNNDILDGGTGADKMLGGAGTDLLDGGFGADRMGGGADADVFAFSAHDNGLRSAGLNDTIVDFQQGIDHLQLSAGDTFSSGFVGTGPNASALLTIQYAAGGIGQVAFAGQHIDITAADILFA